MSVPFITTNALDAQLDYIRDNMENLYLCSSEPATFTEASSTYKIATKASPTIGAPEDSGVDGGRKMVVSQIVDGAISSTAVATHFALTDDSASELLLVQELEASQSLISGEEFRMDSFDIEARPASAS